MPTESSIFIAKFQDEFTAWNPASTVVPNRAAEATVITIAARMASVRMNSGRPSPPAAAMPDRRGRSAAPSAFAHSTAGTVRNSPMNHCAIIVAAPDPAMLQPNPNTNSTSSMVLSTAPHTAATNVMRTFCKPRKMPFAAYTSSMPGAPSTTACVYATAWSSVSPVPLSPTHSGRAPANRAAASTMPMPRASHSPSMPACSPSRRRPAPSR